MPNKCPICSAPLTVIIDTIDMAQMVAIPTNSPPLFTRAIYNLAGAIATISEWYKRKPMLLKQPNAARCAQLEDCK